MTLKEQRHARYVARKQVKARAQHKAWKRNQNVQRNARRRRAGYYRGLAQALGGLYA